MNGQEIFENFVNGPGPDSLTNAQTVLNSVAGEYQELAASIAAVAAAFEEGWTGDAAGAAERGAGPLSAQHAGASEALTVAQDLLGRQVDSFLLAKNSVEPVPPVPAAPSSMENVMTLGSAGASYEAFVSEANSVAQRNVAAMELWANHSTYNTEMMPTSYGEISQPEVSIALAEPVTGGTGGGPSDSDVAPGQSSSDASALPEKADPEPAPGSQPGLGTQPAPGPQPGTGTQPGSGPQSDSGTQPGSGTQAAVAVPIEGGAPATPTPAPTPPPAPSPGVTVAPPTAGPGAPAPGSPRPGTPAPGTPRLGTPTPGTPAPGTPAPRPGTSAPGVPAPGTPNPGQATPQRPTTQPTGPQTSPPPTRPTSRTAPLPGTPAPTRPAAADDGEHERRYGVPEDKHFQPAEDGKKVIDPRTGLPAAVPVIGG